MSINMDAAVRIKADVKGGAALQAFNRDLKGLDGAAKLSGAQLGKMNIAINRMAREAGNTTAGLRQHLSALQNLRDRVEIGGKAYNRLGGEIDALRGKLRGLDRDAEKTGSTLKEKLVAGLAGLGIGRIAAGITQTAANFDQEVRKAAAIEGSGNYDALRKSIEGVAAAAAGTPTQVAQLATALSRAGFTAEETSKSLSGIVKGAEATAITFEEMGSVMSDVMRSFGIDVNKTEAVVDILVKTANSSNQTVLDLGEAMKYAAPIARTLGVNVNDLAATMALMANNGIRGSDAGTALRSGLSRLQIAASGSNEELMGLTRGSALLAKAMKAMGADVLDARGQLRPMDEVILSLRENMKKLPIGQRAEVAKALFGDEAGSKFLALLNSSEEQITSMFNKIRNSGGAAGKTQKEMQGFAYSMQVLGGNIEIVTNAIGDKFTMVLGPLVNGLNAAIGWTQTWPKPLRDVAAAAAAAGIAVGGFVLATKALTAIGAVAVIKGMAGALAGAAVAAKGFAAALLANPIGLVVAGVAALTVAAYNMNEPFKQFVDTIPQRMGVFWDSLVNDGTYAANQLQAAWEAFGSWFNGLWDGISAYFSRTWQNIKNTVKAALKAIGLDATWISQGMNAVANEIEYWWNTAFRFIAENWQKTVAFMVNSTNPLFDVLNKLGIVDVGGATASALFGELPPVPTRRAVEQSNIIGAAPLDAGPPGGLPGGGGTGTGAGAAASGASRKSQEKSLAAEIASALKGALNLTDAQAAGIVGNFMRESGLNPRINEGGMVGLPRGIGGYGLAQWTGSRQTDLIRFAGGAAQAGNLQTQLRFVVKELLGSESRALASLRKAQTPEEAAFVFDRDYERSGIKAMGERQANARRVFSEIAGAGPGAGLGDFAGSLEDQNKAIQDAVGLTQTLQNQTEDLQAQINGVGATAVDALRNKYSTSLREIDRETKELTLKAVELWRQSGEQIDLTNEGALARLINGLADAKRQLADKEFLQGLKDMLPTLDSYDQQIREGTLLLENRKMGVDKLTESQKLQLQIDMLGLEVLAATNPALREHIDLLKKRAAELDRLNSKASEKTLAQGLKEQMEGLGRNLGDTLMSAFDNLINKTKSWKEFMSDALKQIGSMLLRIGLNLLAGPMGSGGFLSFLGFGFAKGGVMTNKGPAPLKAYARGGIANSPQMALFGEGSTPEAYVPLPDGRRIPVAMRMPGNDNSKMRELMGAGPAANQQPVLSMKFETTKINGVEYVSREQLETAMAQTRRQAARDGAKRGMSMTLDKLQQSPATRSRVGIR